MSDHIVGSASVGITPDASGFFEKLRAQLEPGTKELGDAIGHNIGQAMYDRVSSDIDRIRLRLDELAARDYDIRVRVDDNGSAAATAARIGAVDAAANNAGNGGVNILGGRLLGLGALAVAGAAIAIPALLAVGAAAGGAIAGLGVGLLGLSGIGSALQAHGQPTPGGGTGVASAGVSQAQQQLTARQATQTAQDQLTSAERIHTDAITNLAKAQRDARQAQVDLTLARVQAKKDLQDLDNSVKDNALAQQQAAIKLAEAKRVLAVTLSAPGASLPQYAQQVAQAKLDAAAAQQKVDELALQGQRLTADDAKANKAGVEGAKVVVDAKNKVVDTNVALGKAQANLIDSSHKLAEAQQNIGDTALKNALAAQQSALGMQSAAAGANAFGQAMAKLNPLQQQFVDFLIQMKPLLDQVKLAASGFLPGLEQGIKNAAPAFQPLLLLIGNVAKAMGSVFANIGTALASPSGQKFITFLATELPKVITALGNGFISFGKLVANIFQAAAPLISAFAKAMSGLFDGLTKGSGGNALKAFFDSLLPVMPKLGAALSAIGGLLGGVLVAIVPALGPILDLIKVLATELGKIARPVLVPLARAFGDLVHAVEPIIPLLGQMIRAYLPPLIRLLDVVIKDGILPFAKAWADAVAPVIPVVAQLINQLVDAIAPFIVQLIQSIIPFLPQFASMLIALLNAVLPLVPVFGSFLKALTPLLKPLITMSLQMAELALKLLPLLTPLIVLLAKTMPVLTPVINAIAGAMNSMNSATQQGIDLFGKMVKFISRIPDDIGKVVPKLLDAGKKIAGAIFDGLKAGFHAVGSFAADVATSIWNAVKDFINKELLDPIRDFHVKISIGPYHHTFQPFGDVPRLAAGATILPQDGGTLAMLAEAGRPESVVDTGLMNKQLDLTARLVEKLVSNGGGGGRGVGGGSNIWNINGATDPAATAHAVSVRQRMRAI